MNLVKAGSPIGALEKQPSAKKDIVALHDNTWNYLKNSRQGLEYRIKEAQYFLEGNQWIRYVPHNQRFGPHDLQKWVPTPVTNLLIKQYDRILDVLTSGPLNPIVDPASQDIEDVASAKAAQRIARSEFLRQNTEGRIYIPLAAWLIIAGNAFVSSRWNPRLGRTLNIPDFHKVTERDQVDIFSCAGCSFQTFPGEDTSRFEGQGTVCPGCNQPSLRKSQIDDPNGQPREMVRQRRNKDGSGKFKQIAQGDVEEAIISPLHLYPQPAQDWEIVKRHGYAMEVQPVTTDWIRTIFGSADANKVTGEALDVEQLSGVPLPSHHPFHSADPQAESDSVLLKILRHAPSHKFPKGHFSMTANGILLYESKNGIDSTLGVLPYEHIKYRHLPGVFWGGSAFSDLLSMQKRVNSIDSHIVANRKVMINGQWMVPKGSEMSPVDGRAGLEINYNPIGAKGHVPQKIPGVPLPAQVLQEREQMKQDMDEIGGARDAITGGVPSSGMETGAAFEAVQEQAFRKFGPTVKLMRIALAQHEKNKLVIIQHNWDEPRLVRALGDNSDVESFYYQGADILRAEDMHVRVSVGAAFSEAAKRQRIAELIPTGIFGDLNDPAIRGKLLERLDIEGFESEYLLDAKKARRTIQRILNNDPPPPILPGVDNHSVQFSVLKDFILTDEYEGLDQQQQTSLFMRAMNHKEHMEAANQQMMAAAQAAKGAPEQITDELSQAGALRPEAVQTQQ